MKIPEIVNPFSEAETRHLLSFIGYGNVTAPVWFLGMEEGGGGQENLRRRLAFEAVEDLYLAHCKLGITKYHEGFRAIQRTWSGMCRIMLMLEDHIEEPTREQIRSYQSERLGRTNAQTFLLELMPLPKPNTQAWDYDRLFPQYDSQNDYYQSVLPDRLSRIRALVEQHKPRAVVAYGKGYWHHFQKLFPSANFSDTDGFRLSSGLPFVLLSHHFTARTMNGRFKDLARHLQEGLGL